MRTLRSVLLVTLLGLGVVALLPHGITPIAQAQVTLSNTATRSYWVPAGACMASESANSATPIRYTATTTSGLQVVVSGFTSASAQDTSKFVCHISPPSVIVSTVQQLAVVDAVFFYTPVTGALFATQASVAASGTLNSNIVFGKVTLPTPSASETASSATLVRADSGTLVFLPTVASFNVTTTTAGQFLSQKFTPASPIAWSTDLMDLLLTVTLKTDGGTVSVQSPGVLVHYRGL